MVETSIAVFAVNATVIRDISPAGKPKFIIKLNKDAGEAVDRVQYCHDFSIHKSAQPMKLLEDAVVFKDDDTCYTTFSMRPRSDASITLLTCRCDQSELSHEKAIELVEKGMRMAIDKLAS